MKNKSLIDHQVAETWQKALRRYCLPCQKKTQLGVLEWITELEKYDQGAEEIQNIRGQGYIAVIMV